MFIYADPEPSARGTRTRGTADWQPEAIAGWTPLLAAARGNHLGIVQELLAQEHVNANQAAGEMELSHGDIPLNIAAELGQVKSRITPQNT